MTDDRQAVGCGRRAACAAAAHSGGQREGRLPAARAGLPLHHARRGRPRHRRLDHRAGLLPVQEEDGRGLRHVDRAARRAARGRRAKTTPTNTSARRKSIAARSKCRCPSRFAGVRPAKLALELRLQGCADAGLCYPPQKWKTEVALPAAGKSAGGGLSSLLGKKSGRRRRRFPAARRSVSLRCRPAAARLDPAHLGDRRRLLPLQGQDQRREHDAERADRQAGAAARASRSTTSTSATPRCTTKCSKRRCRSRVPPAAKRSSVQLKVTYQGCAEGGLCYNPITKEAVVELPPTSVATTLPADARPAAAEQQRRCADGRGAGQARRGPARRQPAVRAAARSSSPACVLSLTPCVLPMIPILSGIIVGQGENVTRGAQLLAGVHVRAGHGAHVRRGRRDLRARFQAGAAGVLPAAVDRRR